MPQPHLVLAIGMPGGLDWIIILVIMLLLFGNKLPSVMRNLGGSVKEFKKGMEDADPNKPLPPAQVAPPLPPAASAQAHPTTPTQDHGSAKT